ncbi:hypothetical protein N658DRAFT_554772 [Parathielavia hyrcaniae]|uniref:Uncharacterized protein n=1 Tax=Parathielavia hyrcaniae TaxID=113614 RepID=A0AAN6PSR9_9PEZI|nr:hypothetical protein N658DRAFT_554772 [Parathielavia hyrcaniae]
MPRLVSRSRPNLVNLNKHTHSDTVRRGYQQPLPPSLSLPPPVRQRRIRRRPRAPGPVPPGRARRRSQGVVRVCRPGGGVVSLRETDMAMWCFWPETDALQEGFRALMARTLVAN